MTHWRSHAGSSLVEAIISTGVMAFGALGVSVLFVHGPRMQALARDGSILDVRARAAGGDQDHRVALVSDRRGFTLIELLVTSVITLMILGIVALIVVQSNHVYRAQRQFMDARDNVAATLDMIVRVVRMAQTITPDPENDGVMNSISR